MLHCYPLLLLCVFQARCKCQNSLSICIFMGFIATKRTHAVTSCKGNTILSGLPSPTLSQITQCPQSCSNWVRSTVSVVISQGENSPCRFSNSEVWCNLLLHSGLPYREAEMVVLKHLLSHPINLSLLSRTMILFRYLSILLMIR